MLDMARERDAAAYRTPNAKGRPASGDGPDVAGNLRRLRKARGLSLETLARRSGVSRAMLGQIETGRSIPTITLIWKVAKALGVALSDMIEAPAQGRFSLLARTKIRTITAPDGGFQQVAYTTPDLQTPYEFSEIRIGPGHVETFAPRAPGTRATLVVTQGVISVGVGDLQPVPVATGDAILICADQSHSFANTLASAAIGFLVVGTCAAP